MEISRLARDGTAEPVSRDQILRHARGQGNTNLTCSADHEQDWQPYPVDTYSGICDDHTHTYIRTYMHTYVYSGTSTAVIWLLREEREGARDEVATQQGGMGFSSACEWLVAIS